STVTISRVYPRRPSKNRPEEPVGREAWADACSGRTMARARRDEPLELAHAAPSLRWLALAALIALGTLTSAPVRTPPGFYVVILLYTLGLSLYAWRYADR